MRSTGKTGNWKTGNWMVVKWKLDQETYQIPEVVVCPATVLKYKVFFENSIILLKIFPRLVHESRDLFQINSVLKAGFTRSLYSVLFQRL